MRHGRLVAAGLAAGAVLGFLGEFVRPRAGTGARVDLTEPRGPGPRRPGAVGRAVGAGPTAVTDLRTATLRAPGPSPYTDAVTLAMAARGLGPDRFAVATDGEVHG